VKKLIRLVGRQLRERHIVRDAGIVDEHGERLVRAHIGDRRDAGIGAEIGDQETHVDIGKRCDEFFEPIAATAHDHEVVSVGAEPSSKGPTDAGRCPGDERQPRAFAIGLPVFEFAFGHVHNPFDLVGSGAASQTVG
jgi:hypothetical protein